MVLVATFGLSILAWFNSNLSNMQRIERKLDTQEPIRTALSFLESVNPMEQPTGSAQLGSYSIEWSSELLEPERDGVTRTGAKGLFKLGIYQLTVDVKGGREPVQFSVRQVGWKQVRSPLEGIE